MAISPTTNTINILTEAIENQIRKEVNAVFDREKDRVIQELEGKRDEVVAKASLKMMKYMDIQKHTDRLIITLDTRGIK